MRSIKDNMVQLVGHNLGRSIDVVLINPPSIDSISQRNEKGIRDIPA